MYGFIYITTNDMNGMRYIGQKYYDKRGEWKKYLGSGIHLKNAINKYGSEHFSKEIIEECDSKEKLDEREIYWIKYYDAVSSSKFYNIARGGDGGNVIAGYSDKEREKLSNKLSNIRKGKINKGNKNGSARKVICLNTMKIFDTIVDASKFYNVSKDAIQQCCSDSFPRTKTAGEIDGERLQWKYYEYGTTYEYVPFKRVYKTKKIKCVDNGIIYNSISDASNMTGCTETGIRACCNGYVKKTKHMSFSYI